jgi:predicted Ser/Thr protein kinase
MVELASDQVVAGRYRVLRLIGRGGMGAVYLVQHLETDEQLALKILHHGFASDDVALERFRREARAPARIDSDYVARVYDTGVCSEADDAPFIVMDYLRGENLQRLSETVGPLPEEEVIIYAQQVARALDKAHGLGIVHRDMKPENVFLTMREDGFPCLKVLDFGIAKLTGAAGDLESIKATSTGDVFGTPLYMSPEQCLSEIGEVGPASDIWSLGLVAHRLLTGREFWKANNLTHLIGQVAYEPIPKPSEQGCELGAKYDAWFARCCARDPKTRFPSAMAAIDALAAALGIKEENLTTVNRRWIGLEQAKETVVHELALTATALTRTGLVLGPTDGEGRKRAMLIAFGTAAVAVGAGFAWLTAPRATSLGNATISSPSVVGSGRLLVIENAVDPSTEDSSAAPSAAMPTATTSAAAALSAEPATPGRRGANRASSSARSGLVRPPRPRQTPPAAAATASPASGGSAAPVTSGPSAKPVDPLAGRH